MREVANKRTGLIVLMNTPKCPFGGEQVGVRAKTTSGYLSAQAKLRGDQVSCPKTFGTCQGRMIHRAWCAALCKKTAAKPLALAVLGHLRGRAVARQRSPVHHHEDRAQLR